MRRTSILTIAFSLFVGAPAGAAPTPIDGGTVGVPGSDARAELFRPAGSGPFPAMVVLHGCDGIGAHCRDWAGELAAWGYGRDPAAADAVEAPREFLAARLSAP